MTMNIPSYRRADWGCYGITGIEGSTVLCFDYEGHFELPLEKVRTHQPVTAVVFREEEERRTHIRFSDSLRFWAEDLFRLQKHGRG